VGCAALGVCIGFTKVNFHGFHFLEIVHNWFHLDEIPFLSFFINYWTCHKKVLCGNSFIKNETHIESSIIRLFSVVVLSHGF
jgi:hypothetical protein